MPTRSQCTSGCAGPGGLGALYIRRDRIADVQPAAVSRHAAATFDFTGGYSEARDSIEKFELTTVSGVLLAGGIAAVEQYLETGPQALWDRVRALNAAAEARIGEHPGRLRSPARSATPPAPASSPSAPRASIRRCWRRSCGCPAASSAARSPRPRSVRLSLHGYNNEDDIEVVARIIEEALASGLTPEAEAAAAAQAALFAARAP